MKYNTKDNRIRSKPEYNDGKSNVDVAGYVSKRQRIDALMRAGQRLIMARREGYHYVGNDPDPEIDPDPTQRVGYDLADASEVLNGLKVKKGSIPKAVKDEKYVEKSSDEKVNEAKKEVEA